MHAHLNKFHLGLGWRSGNAPWIDFLFLVYTVDLRFVIKNEVFPFCTCGHKTNTITNQTVQVL